jgi:hypothetical protein
VALLSLLFCLRPLRSNQENCVTFSEQQKAKMKKDKKTKPNIDFQADTAPKSDGELTRVREMAQQLLDVEYSIARAQEELETLLESQQRIVASDLPALMEEVGIKEFTLASGERVIVKPIIKASLPAESAIEKQKDKDKQAEMRDRFKRGLNYLQKNGAGSLVKQTIKADFGKDAAKKVRLALSALRALGVAAEVHAGVHPNSLTSWVKERIEGGKPVDFDLLGVYSGQVASIDKPKKD